MLEPLRALARSAYARLRSTSLAWELRRADGAPPHLRRIALSTPRWAKTHQEEAEVLEVHPAGRVTFPAPRTPDRPTLRLASLRIPPGFVVRLTNAELGGPVTDIFTPHRTFLAELSS